MYRLSGIFIILLSIFSFSTAQDDVRNHPFSVFVESNIDATGLDRLLFVDMLTGETTDLTIYGERYTIYDQAVLFYDYAARQMRLATPDGTTQDHPFIQMRADIQRVDWVVSEDRNQIAWTLTGTDAQARLETTTFISDADGTTIREVYTSVDEANRNTRAMPIALDTQNNRLYMDLQPDRIREFTPFKLYAQLFSVDLTTGEMTILPGEAGRCLCGADVRRNTFIRPRLTDDLQAYDIVLHDLNAQVSEVLPALRFNTRYETGDIIIAPDGDRAIYTLSSIEDFGQPNESINTLFILVDLNARTHQPLIQQPIRTFVIPAGWSDDSSALLLANPNQNGTWKINIADGRLERIADATYIGQLLR